MMIGEILNVKLCPKCGGQPVYRMVGDNKQYYILECGSCGYIAAKLNEARHTKLGARLLWNRRAEQNG